MLRSPLSDRSIRRMLRAIDREQAALEAVWEDPDQSDEELQSRHYALRELARALANAGYALNRRVPVVATERPLMTPMERRHDVRGMAV